jgi:hypothetical protein
MIDLVIDFDSQEDKSKLFGILKHLKGRHAVGIKKDRKTRSLAENRYYWGVVLTYLADETGYSKEEAHQVFGRMFLRYDKQMSDGTTEAFVRSTTSLNTLEFEEYLEKIRIFALSELGTYIPLPSEIVYETNR